MGKELRFSHCHCHFHNSPDGLGLPEDMIKQAKRLGYDALSITDHGTLGGVVEFSTICQEYDIKPIVGLEAYYGWKGKRFHITLNSMNFEGYKNLVRLSNAAHENWTSGYPLLTDKILDENNLSGIALFTGCPAGPIHEGTFTDAVEWVGNMRGLFGPSNIWAEMMFVMSEDMVTRPHQIAKHFGLPIIVTGDVHYPLRVQHKAHTVLTECRKGYTYDSSNLWLKSPEEILAVGSRLFPSDDIQKWMNEAYQFSDKVEPWFFSSTPKLPKVSEELKQEFFVHLENCLLKDVMARSFVDKENRRKRYHLELATLKSMGFIDYFVITYDIVSFAHKNDIMVGPGRGSSAGSYILYLLGITNVDPIDHGLYFERFLNPAREEYPDVDVDIESDRRQEVLDYASSRWGGVPVATYSHYGHKSAVNDIGRVLHLNRKKTIDAAEKGRESVEFEEWASLDSDTIIAYDAMIGQIRHASKHAGGFIITDNQGVVPIERIGDTLVAAWTEGLGDRQLSRAGIVKFDLLSVTALSQIKKMRALLPDGVTPISIPEDDDPIFDVFCGGDVAGIFQWTGSLGIKELTKKIAPRTFNDLVVINSLWRPGANDAGTAELYPSLRDRPRLIEPRIDEILAETRGVIVFQEQVMSIFSLVVGGSLAEADLARRVIFKPKIDDPTWIMKAERIHSDFLEKGAKNGFDLSTLEKVWSEIYTHTRYSFNRSHSTAYTMIACEMAWFKKHFPLIFYAVSMEYDSANVQAYLLEAVSNGITVKTPHVNDPADVYQIDVTNNAVQMPLNVKYFGKAEKIIEEYYVNGPFTSVENFLERVKGRICNTRARYNLDLVGAFDGLDGDHSLLYDGYDERMHFERSKFDRQIEAFGFVIPTKTIAEYINSFSGEERIVVGFIKDWSERVNKRGETYRVYYVIPDGIFWMDDGFDHLKKGDLVHITKTHYGKAAKRQKLTVKGE